MLAALALASPRALGRTELTGLLWSRREPEQARASLRQCVHELQETLANAGPEILRAERANLSLASHAVVSDAGEVVHASVARPEGLDALGRGPFLQDLVGLDAAFDTWIREEAERLRRAAASVAEATLAACLAATASGPEIRTAAERVVAIDRTHEGAWRALMHVLAEAGERAAAVAAYEQCCAALAQHARLTPSVETETLVAAIRARPAAIPLMPRRPEPPSVARAPARAHRPGSTARLGVMPFRTLETGLPDMLALGLAEEITAAMARFRGVSLIASPSLAVVQAATSDERARSLDSLALDFLIDGTVQRSGGRVRVTAQLIDMQPGDAAARPIVWAQRFDATDTDLLTVQDRVAAEMVARVDPEMLLRAGARTRTLTTSDLGAYELMLRAIPAIYGLDRSDFEQAGALLGAAVARDPEYAAAHAWLAYWLAFRVGQDWSDQVMVDLDQAGEAAERAVRLDPADARALTMAGHVRAFLQNRLAEAHALHAQALALNPNMPLAWVLSGLAHAYDGAHEEALRRCDEAHRLSPFDPHRAFYDSCAMLPLVMLRRFESAAELARRAIAVAPTLSSAWKGYLAALGHLGDMEGCEMVRARLLALEPRFCVRSALRRSPLRRPEDRAFYAEGLRRGGLREEE
jgi:DNA-binding SARP family transcriptional activator/TolB-like protein